MAASYLPNWHAMARLSPRSFVCGFCGDRVGSNEGYHEQTGPSISVVLIYVCPSCHRPTFFDEQQAQWPGVPFGSPVEALPPAVEDLYSEARRCMSVSAYTTAAM